MAEKTATFTVTVKPQITPQPLTLSPDGGALPDQIVGTPVADHVTTVSGGAPPYSFKMTAGTKPDGEDLFSTDNADGSKDISLEGNPTTAGDFSFDLTVTDALGAVATLRSAGRTQSRKVRL